MNIYLEPLIILILHFNVPRFCLISQYLYVVAEYRGSGY